MHIFLLSVALLCWVASPTVAYHAAVKVYDPAKNIEYYCEVAQERRKKFGEPISLAIEAL